MQKEQELGPNQTELAGTGKGGAAAQSPGISDELRVKVAVETAVRIALAREELLTLTEVGQILKESRKRVITLRNRESDPLPTFLAHGRPRTQRGDLYDWIDRQKRKATDGNNQ